LIAAAFKWLLLLVRVIVTVPIARPSTAKVKMVKATNISIKVNPAELLSCLSVIGSPEYLGTNAVLNLDPADHRDAYPLVVTAIAQANRGRGWHGAAGLKLRRGSRGGYGYTFRNRHVATVVSASTVAALDYVSRSPEIDLMGDALGYRFHAHLLQFRRNLTRRIVKPKPRQSISKSGDRDDHQQPAYA
jgi:hypothetical protein